MLSGQWALFYAETMVGKALSPELYGDYRVVITLITFLGQLLLFGLDYILVKHIPQLLLHKGKEHAKFFLISMLRFIIYVFLVWELLGIFINQSVNNLMFDRLLPQDIHPGYFYLACAGVYSLVTLSLKIIRSLDYKILNVIMYNLWTWLFLGFMLVVPITLNSAVLSTMASYLVIICVCCIVIFLFFRKVRASRFALPQHIFKDAFHFTAQQFFAFQVSGILLILMEVLPAPETDIGIFSATIMISNLSLIVVMGIKNLFLMQVIPAIHGDKVLLKKLLTKVYIVAAALMLPTCVILYLLTPFLLHLYGLHFEAVFMFILFPLVGNIPGAIASGDVIFLNYCSTQTNKIFTYLTIFKAVLCVVMGMLLIKFFGIYGAMITYVAVEIIFALLVIVVKRAVIAKISYA
jgi:O-antigen/teichoic acid export membrane protein